MESTGHDAKGGWLDPLLVRTARGEEMQYEKKHAYEKVSMSQCWKETGEEPHQDRLGGEEPHQDRLGGHEQGERPSVRT